MEKTMNKTNEFATVLTSLLGMLMMVCGIHCITSPILTFMTLTQIMGFLIIIAGIIGIVHYTQDNSKDGHWDLFLGSFELLLGSLMISNLYGNFLTTVILTSLVATWLLIKGLEGIMLSFSLKNLEADFPKECRTHLWVFTFIVAVLTTILGILCLCNPIFSMFSASFLIGVSVLSLGAQTLIFALCIL